MKVMFDSNTWRLVVDPDLNSGDKDIESLKIIHSAISDGKIEPYLSETIFTLEAIVRKHRQGYFAKSHPKITSKIEGSDTNVSMSFTMGPNEKDDIIFTPDIQILKDYFDKAVQQGFRIVRLPRIGGFKNPEVDRVLFKVSDFEGYYSIATEVSERIEFVGAGMSWIVDIAKQYNSENWIDGIRKAPASENKKIAKAAAEWADGDSVAISIGLKCDYFCTRDHAKNAGTKSVFSDDNISWLEKDYGFKIIDTASLAALFA